MQVMPFWPEKLGIKRYELIHRPNIHMGCAILRYYLRYERSDGRRALARYNGSVGQRGYPRYGHFEWSRWNGLTTWEFPSQRRAARSKPGQLTSPSAAHLHDTSRRESARLQGPISPAQQAMQPRVLRMSRLEIDAALPQPRQHLWRKPIDLAGNITARAIRLAARSAAWMGIFHANTPKPSWCVIENRRSSGRTKRGHECPS